MGFPKTDSTFLGGQVMDDADTFPSIYLSDHEVGAIGAADLDVDDERVMIATVRVSSKSRNGKYKSVTQELREAHLERPKASQGAPSGMFPTMKDS